MDSLTINRKIIVKAIVTDSLKTSLIQEIQDGIKRIDAELTFLDQRAKKTITELTLKASPQIGAVREQLEYEKQKREEAKYALSEQMKMVTALENGNEIIQGELEGPVDVKIGADWEEIMQREIVIKDGKVIAIR